MAAITACADLRSCSRAVKEPGVWRIRDGWLDRAVVVDDRRPQVLAMLHRDLEWSRIYGTDAFVAELKNGGPAVVLAKVSIEKREYLARMLELGDGELPEVRLRLATIHAAKGQEADLVYLYSDMSRASYDAMESGGTIEDRESEFRCAYVAVSRARSDLVVILPKTRRYFPFGHFIAVRTDKPWPQDGPRQPFRRINSVCEHQ